MVAAGSFLQLLKLEKRGLATTQQAAMYADITITVGEPADHEVGKNQSCVDPQHIDADPDSTYHPDAELDADADSDFLFDEDPEADPDPTLCPDADPDPSSELKARILEKC
jgi:hypothetical protein